MKLRSKSLCTDFHSAQVRLPVLSNAFLLCVRHDRESKTTKVDKENFKKTNLNIKKKKNTAQKEGIEPYRSNVFISLDLLVLI